VTKLQLQALEREVSYFNSVQDDLKRENPQGGHVVIKDHKVLGVFGTRNDALEEGLKAFGNVVFLVRSIEDEKDHHINFSFNSRF